MLFIPYSIYSQEIKTPAIHIIEPTIDPDLKIGSGRECDYRDNIGFIINKEYVIYQDCNNHTIFYPDIASFRTYNRYGENMFAVDKDAVYFMGTKIKTDTTDLQVLRGSYYGDSNDHIWKTKDAVYKNTEKIEVTDVASFEQIGSYNSNYFKDSFFVYYIDKKIEVADVATIETANLSKNFAFDKNNSYLNGEIIKYENEKIIPVNNTLYKTTTHVLTKSDDEFTVIENIDAPSLKSLSSYYAIDKNNAYYMNYALPLTSDQLQNLKVWEIGINSFFSDGEYLYYEKGTLQKDLDVKTFERLENTEEICELYFDKNGIYYGEYDFDTMEVIHQKIPFLYNTPISQKDIIKTEYRWYVLYKNQLYHTWDKTITLNLTKEQIQLAKEHKLSPQLLPIDQGFGDGVYKIKNKIYWDQTVTAADATTFSPLIEGSFKDANHVYIIDKIKGFSSIKGIDSHTIEEFHGFIKDTNYLYTANRKIIKSKDIELLGIFTGNKEYSSQSNNPSSDFYLFKNVEGYWLVKKLVSEIIIRRLGDTLDTDWKTELLDFKLK
ncbi:hypothetical protein GCM10022393_19070 [Aquimarina addita]|uniref:DKNYY family protein n=2 Tax=Aquimarina addita TaxID=870485 RepID=A0ABP6UKE7_9FLAO